MFWNGSTATLLLAFDLLEIEGEDLRTAGWL
jgi:hypothetical protein